LLRFKKSKSVEKEYEEVKATPIINHIIEILVTLLDLVIMFLLLWNMFHFCIPYGSWLNAVSGDSMLPNLKNGQLVFTDMSEIKHGDIVISYMPEMAFENHPERIGSAIVKRVIGLPGDRIVISSEGVYRNGVLIDETYLTDDAKQKTYYSNNINAVTLQEDEYYLLGDNRGVSFDSRSFGPISTDELIFKQSVTPTPNFWLKTLLIVLIFVLDIYLYSLIEFVLTECAYYIISKSKNARAKDSVIESKKENAHRAKS